MVQNAALRHYMRRGYMRVIGASSLISGNVLNVLLEKQSGSGLTGEAVEIGVSYGRFAIAMALGLAEGERLYAIDLFDAHRQGMQAAFETNLARWGADRGRCDVWAVDSASLTPAALQARLAGRKARVVHLDGDHTRAALAHDLELGHAILAPHGILILDDMHHPYYPELTAAALSFLQANPQMRLLAVIDRASVVGATKYIICHQDYTARYTDWLAAAFRRRSRRDAVDMTGYKALMITALPFREALQGGRLAHLGHRIRKLANRWRNEPGHA